jgi:hypothetical protein
MDYAKSNGWCSGENPARWKGEGNLKMHLRSRNKFYKPKPHAMLQYCQIPAFMSELRASAEPEARAPVPTESFDFHSESWEIPSARMRMKENAHTVPLVGRALEILKELHAKRSDDGFGLPNCDQREGSHHFQGKLWVFLRKKLDPEIKRRDKKTGQLVVIRKRKWKDKTGNQLQFTDFARLSAHGARSRPTITPKCSKWP